MSKIVYAHYKGDKYEVIVDDDYNLPNKIFLSHGYACINKDGKVYRLHRYIMDAKKEDMYDHINRNKLDNRKENLRLTNKSLNGANRKYKGVSLHKASGKWVTSIMIDYKYKYLGLYATPEEAQEVYRKAHAEAFGEFSPYYEYYSGITKEVN